jgi:hypothetical protein
LKNENNFVLKKKKKKKKENLLLLVVIFNIILCLGTGFGMSKCDPAILVPVFVCDAAAQIVYVSI